MTSLVTGLAMYLLRWCALAGYDHPAGLADLHVRRFLSLLGLILGAMMASDLGGPSAKRLPLRNRWPCPQVTNSGNHGRRHHLGYGPAAGHGLATTLRPKLFSEAERENGKAAWSLGASFISEALFPSPRLILVIPRPLWVVPSPVPSR